MAPNVQFFAWAVPAFTSGSPVDHTWVTTYDNRVPPVPQNVAQVIANSQFYWFCWGAFHPQGGTPVNTNGYLGAQIGDLSLAQCLVKPNADSRVDPAARGTIFTYGVDGVCHQLANQVLYATGTGGARQLTVSNARGYHASTFIYGTYGLQHGAWANRVASCTGAPVAMMVPGGPALPSVPPDSPVPPLRDDFEERVHQVLGQQDPKLLADLLALRAETTRFAAQRWPGFDAPGADALNARNAHLLDQAAKLLGPDRFEQVFGFAADQKPQLVDPNIKNTGSSD